MALGYWYTMKARNYRPAKREQIQVKSVVEEVPALTTLTSISGFYLFIIIIIGI